MISVRLCIIFYIHVFIHMEGNHIFPIFRMKTLLTLSLWRSAKIWFLCSIWQRKEKKEESLGFHAVSMIRWWCMRIYVFSIWIYRCCRQETLYSSVSDCSVCTIFPSLCLTYKFLLCHQDLPFPWWRTSHRTKEMSHCRLCVPLPRRGNIPCSLGQRHIRLWHGDRLCWVLICRGLQYDSYSRSAHSPSSSDIVSARKKTLQCDSL